MERDAFFTIMYIKVIRDDVFAEDETVAEALRGDAAQRVVVVLIAGHHEADSVAWIRLELFAEKCVAYVVVQTELRIRHMGAGDVLQIDGALCGIHAVMVEMDSEFEIGDGETCQAEMSFARIAFGCGENSVGAFLRIMDFRGLPVREKECVVVSERAELRGAEDLRAVCASDDVGVEQTARHFAFKKDVVLAGGDDKLCSDRATVVCFNRWRRDAVTVGAEREENASSAAFRAKIDGALDGLCIVGDAVCLGTEIHDVESE